MLLCCCFKLGRADISSGRGNILFRWVVVVVVFSKGTRTWLSNSFDPCHPMLFGEGCCKSKRNDYMENFWRWFQLFCWCFRLCLKHCCCCRSWKLTSTRMDVRQQTMHQRPVKEKSTCWYHSLFTPLAPDEPQLSRIPLRIAATQSRVGGGLVFSGIWKLIIKFWANRIRVPLKLISTGRCLCVPHLLLLLLFLVLSMFFVFHQTATTRRKQKSTQ